MKLFRQYAGVKNVISRHWKNYGGNEAVFFSPYFHASVIFGLVAFPYRFLEDAVWWDLAIDILPSLIGFSLGGYAIFLAFGEEGFKRLVGQKNNPADIDPEEKPSPYLSFSVAFVHFIIVQILGLLLAIMGKSMQLIPSDETGFLGTIQTYISYIFGIFSFTIFSYAIFLALAATFAMYRMVWLYDRFLRKEEP